jgi:hypothetical protein
MRILTGRIIQRLAVAFGFAALYGLLQPAFGASMTIATCSTCQTVQDSANFAYSSLQVQFGQGSGGPANLLYIVRNLPKAESYAWVVSWAAYPIYPPNIYYYLPSLTPITVDQEEGRVLDQHLSGRAAILAQHVDQLPTTYFQPGVGDPQTAMGSPDDDATVLSWVNKNPLFRMTDIPGSSAKSLDDFVVDYATGFITKLLDEAGLGFLSNLIDNNGIFGRIMMPDGSYYVINYNKYRTDASIQVYKVSADRKTVTILHQEMLKNVIDPALPQNDQAYQYGGQQGAPYANVQQNVGGFWSSWSVVNCYSLFACTGDAWRAVVTITDLP